MRDHYRNKMEKYNPEKHASKTAMRRLAYS